MRDCTIPKEYLFNKPSEANEYRLFPDELENDDEIFFHGTAAENLASILKDGFKISKILGTLPSLSFAKNSSLALRYACEKRTDASTKGCVIAVRFDQIDKSRIRVEPFGLHVYDFQEQPVIVGYCIIPEDYKFL